MKVGGRSRSGDEEVPVALVEDGVPRVTTTAVELDRPGRPRRELLLVVLAVAVVAGVGLVGGGEGSGDPQETATPSTTERRRPRTESVEEFRSTSSTTRPRPTTTTTISSRVPGTGPLLPGGPTGTVLGYVDSSGVATVVDLDTGDRCHVKVTRADPWSPWNVRESSTMWVQHESEVVQVDRACGTASASYDYRGGWPATVTGDTIWIVRNDESSITEWSLATDEPTGRVIEDVPTQMGLTVVAVDGDLVVGSMGDMTLVDLDSGRRTDLDRGTPLVGRDGVLAYTACPELVCHVGVVDVRTGARRRVADIEVAPWDGPGLSPGGRYLRVSELITERGDTQVVVIDLADGQTMLRTHLQSAVFSADGHWLLGIDNDAVAAIRLEDPSTIVTVVDEHHAVRMLTLLTNP